MTSQELGEHFARLHLTHTEAAQLLGVAARTVRRWLDGEEVPGPVEQAMRAWSRLQDRGLAWRPDSVTIFNDEKQQIALQREHAKRIDSILSRVEARNGPRLTFDVDHEGCRAILGPMEVSFYRLPNGGFTAASYRRTDTAPDVERDWELIEDAIFCFAEAVKRERRVKAKRAS